MPQPQQQNSGSVSLILGGVRSGKSRFAQDLAAAIAGDDVLFVATAEAGDHEMSDRILRHRQSRPPAWQTLECTRQVGTRLSERPVQPTVILLDCLTMLVSNLMLQHWESQVDLEQVVHDEVSGLLRAVATTESQLLVVSGEVGSGIVPDSSMGRRFRDLLGFANQQIAAVSAATWLLVAGVPVDVKQLGTTVAAAAQQYRKYSGVNP